MPGAFSADKAENDQRWDQLLDALRDKVVVPFLGAAASYPHLPTGAKLAESLAGRVNYPMADRWDLARVAQYAAIMFEPAWVKRWVRDELTKVTPPALQQGGAAADEPHRALAEFPLPLFVTTNYDEFMFEALKARGDRNPKLDLCRWNPLLKYLPSELAEPKFQMHPATPVVYHLHGQLAKPESIVLTQDDYLQFGEEMIKRGDELIPPVVAQSLRLASLLFVGYSLTDWNFRLLLRSLKVYMQADNYLVIKPPEGPNAKAERRYLEEYYAALRIRVYWGLAQEFAAELMQRRRV
jgi:hypothetical protein